MRDRRAERRSLLKKLEANKTADNFGECRIGLHSSAQRAESKNMIVTRSEAITSSCFPSEGISRTLHNDLQAVKLINGGITEGTVNKDNRTRTQSLLVH
jgi:hypothetical protein